jgi:serine/threonine protein phosphatase PrpC
MIIENLDCYFTIAKQHSICEDYAITGTEPAPHLIICDGCSTSKNTDIGSRILAMSARKTLEEYLEETSHRELPSYTDFGYALVNRAYHITDLLGVEPGCLDATLMLAIPYHETLYVYVYGDGYIATVNRDEELVYRKFSYEQNMPYYLTYWIDKARRDMYVKANRDGKEVVTATEYHDGQENSQKMDYDLPLVFSFAMDQYRLLALTSDGVSSFFAVEENNKISVKDILEQLVAYKTTKGDFVKRRTRRMIKNYEKQGIYPTDDLSIATLLISR